MNIHRDQEESPEVKKLILEMKNELIAVITNQPVRIVFQALALTVSDVCYDARTRGVEDFEETFIELVEEYVKQHQEHRGVIV